MLRAILALASVFVFSCKNSTEPKKDCSYDARCDLATFEKENAIYCAADRGRYNRCLQE